MHDHRIGTGNIDTARWEVSDTVYAIGETPYRMSTHYTSTKRQAEKVAAAWRRDIRRMRDGKVRVWPNHDGARRDDGRYDRATWDTIGPDRVVSIMRVEVMTR